MLYCAKCGGICEDGRDRCPNCRNPRLRAVNGEDMVLLHRADQYTAQQLSERFDAAGVVYEAKPLGKGLSSSLYDSEVMPTDKILYVRYSDLEAAKEISAGVEESLRQEQGQEDGEFEDMPRRKRILVQILSTVAFLVLVMLTVFGADALANWLKGIFGL